MWIFFTIALGLDIFLGISCTLQFCHRALAHESQSNTHYCSLLFGWH